MYTYEEDEPLVNILKSIYEKENGGAAIDPKSSTNELEAYFRDVLPEYDEDRI